MLSRAFVDAAVEAGHRRNDDFNGAEQDGYGLYELNQRNGVRLSASRAFLHPALARRNSSFYADTLVERIDFSGTRATGMTVVRDGVRQRIAASCEVSSAAARSIRRNSLCCRASGARRRWAAGNCNVAAARPAWGRTWRSTRPLYLRDHSKLQFLRAVAEFGAAHGAEPAALHFRGTGMIASTSLRPAAFCAVCRGFNGGCADDVSHRPQEQCPHDSAREHGFMVLVQLLRPRSRGRIELASADPMEKPILTPRFLEQREDVETLVRGLREARKRSASPCLAVTPASRSNRGGDRRRRRSRSFHPGREVNTAYHPVGTCKMVQRSGSGGRFEAARPRNSRDCASPTPRSCRRSSAATSRRPRQ